MFVFCIIYNISYIYIHTYINGDLVSFLILTDRRQAKGVTGVPRGGDRMRLYMWPRICVKSVAKIQFIPTYPSVFLLSSAVFGPIRNIRLGIGFARDVENTLGVWTTLSFEVAINHTNLFLRPLLCLQIKKLRVVLSLCSSAVLHQRCISYLERDLCIFFSTSLSHDCVMFPMHVRTRRTYLGLYQFIRTAHPFSQNLSLEYCIRTSLCHWSLLDWVGRPRLLPDR